MKNDIGPRDIKEADGRSLFDLYNVASSGFTLLEIMIALAIIGSTLTVILHTVNFHAGIMDDNTVTTRMYQIAKEKMNELEATGKDSKGAVSETGFTYENTAIKQEESDIIELKTVVRGQEKEVTLNLLIREKAVF